MTHMPRSNCEVRGGIASVPELVAAGVAMGHRTDPMCEGMISVKASLP